MKTVILFLLFFPAISIAQNSIGTVIGKKSNLPIEGVNITIKPFNSTTTTDKAGKFKLEKITELQKIDTLYFSHIGYTTKKISFNEFEKNEFTIFLDEQTELLDEVALSFSQNKQLKSKISYTKLAPLKYAISNFGSVLKDNKIYVIGGDASFKRDAWKKLQYENPDPTLTDFINELKYPNSAQMYKGNIMVYDIENDRWDVSKIKFRKRAYHNLNEYNNKIYVIGGKSISANGLFEYLDNKIEVFDINRQTITIDNTNPHQAAEFASFTYKNNLIVMGGSIKMSQKGIKQYTDKVHSYDFDSGYWYELESMPIAKETTGILIKDKIFLFGGFNGNPLSIIESFDLVTEKWQTEGNMFCTLSSPAIGSNNDLIYLFENEKIYTYNIYSKELKEYLINLPMKASKLFFLNEKLYLLGGYIENYYSKFPSPNLYSIDINEFKNTKPNRMIIL
ncbi:Kelch repeat-containing protein [Flavobacterium gilvum]|uniref:Galactose oxidase n=1 Tax=Flavobacterium gilvum TaxID=1492737 RepID=A0AAC9I7B5_9FLAO|nr:carboxypeptidase-like regulatory domain-containing protein [Flavobacterium gilvum]AOW11130.1 galactose oxidase [Flavobacterium gilvum]KFC61062.1 galactose oxidase [Flavobacterium gilvum]